MKQIVSISLGSSSSDYDHRATFLGQTFRIRRFGADHDIRRALELIGQWQDEADVVGLGMVNDHQFVGTRRFEDPTTARLESAVTKVPVTTGAMLRSFLDEWAIRHIQNNESQYFTNARVLFLSGITNYRMAQVMTEYTKNISFADPVRQLGIPKLITSVKGLETYAAGTSRLQQWLPKGSDSPEVRAAWSKHVLRKAMQKATVIVAPYYELGGFTLEELGGKVVMTSAITDEWVSRLGAHGVDVIIDRAPQLLDRVVGLNVLDAMILAALDKHDREDVTYDDYLEIFGERDLEPRILFPGGRPRRVNRFAFVIHPLSREYFKTIKAVDVMSQKAPPVFMSALEKIIAYSPPFVYSHVTGIKSPTGVEAEGWLISVGGTPKELLAHSPEFTYRRLLAAAKMAERLGAQIMGLGAFTKVVGDAGVTVAKRANIPITTGNSYSASGALWAAHDAVRRMGLMSLKPNGKVDGKAMVVGATGAIGSVCARLLAMAVEEVYLVSPEIAKLLTIKETILRDTPDAKLHLSSKADENLRDMDIIVTATSGAGKKILDIMKVKPGCVITDVARPLDLPASEVAKRPDVLVIESGEIKLPGDVKMKNIGLPPGIAYACLAETIVLALEGRFETYTIGRNIQWEKVKEIYRLGLKHGMSLAAISGVNGVFSDSDILHVRELALKARAEQARGVSPSAASSRERRVVAAE